MNYKDLWQPLVALYDEAEAKAIVKYMLDVAFGFTTADIYSGTIESMDTNGEQRLSAMLNRLKKGEPVQYVVGYAYFLGRKFSVDANVLIPRPETEELCQWVASDYTDNVDILDIGTGSGCIATTLALDIDGARVTAWDISDGALGVAQTNASRLSANVNFSKVDALCPPSDNAKWDIIVSNPPYICDKEKETMHNNVLDNEPHLALFVPDNSPLLFYQSIVRYAKNGLRVGGAIYLEINPLYASSIIDLLASNGFLNVELRQDIFGKQRMIKAIK